MPASPKTIRESEREMDERIGELWDALQSAIALKTRFAIYNSFGAVFHEAHTKASAAPLDVVPDPPAESVTMCSVCGHREARIWDMDEPYCKRCARDEGIVVHGKIT